MLGSRYRRPVARARRAGLDDRLRANATVSQQRRYLAIVQSPTIPAAVDGPRAAFDALLALVLGGLLITAEVSPTPPVVLAAVLGLSFFVANAFDPVREHRLYRLGTAAWGRRCWACSSRPAW